MKSKENHPLGRHFAKVDKPEVQVSHFESSQTSEEEVYDFEKDNSDISGTRTSANGVKKSLTVEAEDQIPLENVELPEILPDKPRGRPAIARNAPRDFSVSEEGVEDLDTHSISKIVPPASQNSQNQDPELKTDSSQESVQRHREISRDKSGKTSPPQTDSLAHQSTKSTNNSPEGSRSKKTRNAFAVFVQNFRHAWRNSLQLRTALISVFFASVACFIIGAFLTSSIGEGLFKDRERQISGQAKVSFERVQSSFDSIPLESTKSTKQLAQEAVNAVNSSGDGVSSKAILTPVSGEQSDQLSNPVTSGGITLAMIPAEVRQSLSAAGSEKKSLEATSPDSQSKTDSSNMQGQKNQNNGSAHVNHPMVFQAATINSESESYPAIIAGSVVSLRGVNYDMYIVYDLRSTQNILNEIQGILLLSGFLFIFVITFIAWYVTRRVATPVARAASASEKILAGEIASLDAQGEDDVARLSASFNKMTQNMQNQIEELNDLSEMQQRFVSDVSHELRTPLTTVRMATNVLYDSRDEFAPIEKRSAELLHDQVERFSELLSDLLEVSRFDSGAAVLNRVDHNILEMINDTVTAVDPIAKTHQSTIEIITDEEEVLAQIDQTRIERIFRNLIVNALEHGEGEPVNIYIASTKNTVAVAVRDFGIGLDEEQLQKVFDRFWRADPSRNRTTGGSGLGLSIAMEDTGLHDGWLDVWGEPGKGACFRLTLPRYEGYEVVSSPLPLPPDYDSFYQRYH